MSQKLLVQNGIRVGYFTFLSSTYWSFCLWINPVKEQIRRFWATSVLHWFTTPSWADWSLLLSYSTSSKRSKKRCSKITPRPFPPWKRAAQENLQHCAQKKIAPKMRISPKYWVCCQPERQDEHPNFRSLPIFGKKPELGIFRDFCTRQEKGYHNSIAIVCTYKYIYIFIYIWYISNIHIY